MKSKPKFVVSHCQFGKFGSIARIQINSRSGKVLEVVLAAAIHHWGKRRVQSVIAKLIKEAK